MVQTYEYVFTAAVIVSLLVAAVMLIGMAPQLALNASQVDQLKMAAQKIMTQLILNPGSPPDWGGNTNVKASNLTSFGLAVYASFTRDAYVLDVDKVQRLRSDVPEPLRVSPQRALELLGLGGRTAQGTFTVDYGFKLEFKPAVNVTVQVSSSEITVSAFSEYHQPIPGVTITARIFYAEGETIVKAPPEGCYTCKTNASGFCTLPRVGSPFLLVVVAEYHGVQVVKTHVEGGSGGFLLGDTVLSRGSLGGNAYQVFVARVSNGSHLIEAVKTPLTSSGTIDGYQAYRMGFLEPNAVAVASANPFTAIRREVPDSYGSSDAYPPLSYSLERAVRIGPSMYTLRLQVWRTSW
ncbi:MAG: hypothetical protein QFX33_02230 [Candidatus Nezhaarchaeota archaeon]|nr:hypothetical protein [Candidatus Nezhaarchaeota archaeon]